MIRRRILGASVLVALVLAVVAVNCALPSVKPEVPQATPVLATLIQPPPVPTLAPTPTARVVPELILMTPTTRVPTVTRTQTPEPTSTSTRVPQTPVQKGELPWLKS